jgi:O-succinylbenzoate synthase
MDSPFAFRRYCLAFRHPVRTSHGPWTAREGLYVRVERPDGTAGLGEAAPVPGFGAETVAEDEACCRSLGGRLGGDALSRVPGHLRALRNALAFAIGGDADNPRHSSIGVAALLPAGRAALADAPPKADAGFRVFKWKVGMAAADDEMSLLDDLIGALPPGSRFRLDANGAWDRRTAEKWLDRVSGRPVEFVEQPVAPGAKGADDCLAGLAADYPTPIALDESIAGEADVGRWLDRGWRGYYVVKPALVGDVRAVLASLAKAHARVVFSSALETGIGAQAALRLAFAWPGKALSLGFGVWPLFADPRFDGPAAAPFLRVDDLKRINPEALWSAAS